MKKLSALSAIKKVQLGHAKLFLVAFLTVFSLMFVTTVPPASASNPAGESGCNSSTGDLSNCGTVQKYINPLIRLFSALVGVSVVISIIVGGIQYSMSAGDPQKAVAARARIRNAIIALVAFIFLLAFINFIALPGSVV